MDRDYLPEDSKCNVVNKIKAKGDKAKIYDWENSRFLNCRETFTLHGEEFGIDFEGKVLHTNISVTNAYKCQNTSCPCHIDHMAETED